jgi:hypothetical protein
VEKKERTQLSPEQIVRTMAGRWPDREIALTMNRLLLKTPTGDRYTQVGVQCLRLRLGLAEFDASKDKDTVNLAVAASRLAVSQRIVQKLIAMGMLPASQPFPYGPWMIQAADLESGELKAAIQRLLSGKEMHNCQEQTSLPGMTK